MKAPKFVFAPALHKTINSLRYYKLLDEVEFPILLSAVYGYDYVDRYIVLLKINDRYVSDRLWVNFGKKSISINVSEDNINWVPLYKYKPKLHHPDSS